MGQAAQKLDAERVKEGQVVQLAAIITSFLQGFADTLEEDFEVLLTGTFFRLGDIIILVHLFQRGGDLPSAGESTLVTMEYATSLVGVDVRTGRLDKVRIGTLKFLSMDSLYAVITGAPHMDFSAEAVRRCSEPLKSIE